MILAALWGFAEATLFFIVPDVWLTIVAVRRGIVPALLACAFAVAGALAGGTIMYAWGALEAESARVVLDWLPAISPGMIAEVGRSLDADGPTAMFLGTVTGVPYKIYAVEAAGAGIAISAFLAVSMPARALRFVIVTGLAWGVSAVLSRRLGGFARTALLLGVWGVFYAIYFWLMPN